jgi:hypothetical protein
VLSLQISSKILEFKNFAPPAELNSSLWYLHNTVPQPYYMLPAYNISTTALFNCERYAIFIDSGLFYNYVRCLWKAYSTDVEKVSIAMAKLLGGSFHDLPDVPPGELQTAAVLACAGSRYAISINPAVCKISKI